MGIKLGIVGFVVLSCFGGWDAIVAGGVQRNLSFGSAARCEEGPCPSVQLSVTRRGLSSGRGAAPIWLEVIYGWAEPQPHIRRRSRTEVTAPENRRSLRREHRGVEPLPQTSPVNITVALDGSGQFKSVQEAIMSVPSGTAARPVVIHIKPGVYKELIYIQREKRFFHLIGEDAAKTILTFGLHANMMGSNGKPITTFRTPSTVIDADDVTAENLTFENTAGPVGQALAIRVDGDRVVFRQCRFLGWQDTILLNRGRQYFEDCYIAGHVDFIFGAATAWFERCHIHCLKSGYITAASTYDYQPFGFVFSHCRITGEPEAKTFLGRPWRDFSNVVYLNTEMSDVVRMEGWQNWNLPEREKTARYSEYHSTGAGANPKARVAWSRQLTTSEAKAITVKAVLKGTDNWNPLGSEK
jgi:pectinesterase